MYYGILRIILLTAVAVVFSSVLCCAADGPDAPHDANAPGSIGCQSCHDMTAFGQPNLIPDGGHVPLDIDDTLYNALCWSCHDGSTAPLVQTHSSRQTSSRYGDWTVECWVCHNQHSQAQQTVYGPSAFLYTGTSTGITATTITKSGASWAVDQYKGMIVLPDTSDSYTYFIESNTSDTLTVRGVIDQTAVTAGDTFGIVYGKLIRDRLYLDKITDPGGPKSGYKQVEFFNSSGSNSFADGDATYDGICEVCHTLTSHFRNDGSGSDQLHANVGGAAGTDCMDCHDHNNGFAHGGGSGTGCVDCHGHDAGTLFDPDMTAPYTPGATASPGYGTAQSHSTHTETDGDDQKGPGLYCSGCHDINNIPLFSDGQDLAGTTVCDSCHSTGGTYDGVDDPVVGAKAIWGTGAYVATSDSTLRAGKEKWCATCHDEVGSVVSGVTAPNVIGDEDDTTYIYGNISPGWGYYKTGHGLSSSSSYPASGGITAGAGIECDSCHDFSTVHVDGLSRTFNDSDNEYLDASFYRIGYRLIQVGTGLGAGASTREPMLIPYGRNTGNTANNYRLCANCHASEPFTDPANMNTNLITDGVNRHEYHMVQNNVRWASDWSGGLISRMNCTNCHNVHGSTRLTMVRDGKLTGREPGLKIWYNNDSIVTTNTGNPDPPSPEDLPLSASTGTVWIGASSGNICSHCHGGINTAKEYRAPYQSTAQGPTLGWTEEAGYASDGANPDSVVTGTNVIFRTIYTDTNNDAPDPSVQLWIDENSDDVYDAGEKYAMAGVGGATYYDGRVYTLTVNLTNTGGNSKKYRFYSDDDNNSGNGVATGAATSDSSVYVFNVGAGGGSAPTLAWTGEENYVSDGVNPNSGLNSSSFEFRATYTDTDNHAPAQIQLWVDEDMSGSFSNNEKYAMSVSGGDADYTNGENYTRTVALSCPGGGGCNMKYRFYATDGSGEATGAPAAVNTLPLQNNPPTLTWTGEANYVGDGVDPETAAGGNSYTFRVDYTDADNSAPSVIQVWVDRDNDGYYLDSEKFNLTLTGGDADYTNGERYYTATPISIPYVGDGVVDYRFYAMDGTDTATGSPVTGNTITVTAPGGNNAPALSWATANCLTSGVRPATGAEEAEYEFMVTYTDADNECADIIQVWVDEDDSATYDGDEKFVLAAGAGACNTGRVYSATLQLAQAGAHNYRFFATDGNEAATGTPTSASTVTVISALKVRPTGGIGWLSTINDAIAASGDPSTILVYPNSDFSAATYSENVWVNVQPNRTFQSVCGPDLTIVDGPGAYAFSMQDSNNITVDGFGITGGTNAGIRLLRCDNSSIENSKIYSNTTGIDLNDSSPVLVDTCEIYNNTSRGIYVGNVSRLNMNNSELYSNGNTDYGSAIYINGLSGHTITDSYIHDHTANISAGALYFNAASVDIINTTLDTNQANNAGALYCNGGNHNIINSTFTNNRANAGVGGAMQLNNATVNISNSIFASNQGSSGGVLYTNGGALNVWYSTFVSNQAVAGAGGAFNVCGFSQKPNVYNSIFYNNTASGDGDNVNKTCGPLADFMTFYDTMVDSDAPAHCGGGGATTCATSGNVLGEADPNFTPTYRLQMPSPVIDQANPAYTNGTVTDTDIDGDCRSDNNCSAGVEANPDMGADEYVP